MKHSNPSEMQPPKALPTGFAHTGEHPQLELPFTALVGHRELKGTSISIMRAVVTGSLPVEAENSTQSVALRVNLDGFSLILWVDALVEGVGTDAITLHFTDPTASHAAPLRYLLNSYVAGDIVSMGGMMGYTGPVSVKAKSGPQDLGRVHKIKNLLRRALVVVLTLLLAVLAFDLARDRILFAYEPRPVTITAPGQTLMATTAGQLAYIDAGAGPDQVVYSIAANSGEYISVKMPCDCGIQALRDFELGATVLPGSPLVRLTSGQEGLVASTEISPEGAARLVSGDRAELVTASGRVIPLRTRILPARDDTTRTIPIEMVLTETDGVSPGDVARLRLRKNLIPAILRGDTSGPQGE